MKKLGCILSLTLLSTVYASELDIQKGQWSAEVDNIDFNLNLGGTTATNGSGVETKSGALRLAYNIRGRYAFTDTLILRLETGYSALKEYRQELNDTSKIWDEPSTRSRLAPAIEYFISDNLALLGGLGLSGSGSDAEKGFNFKFFGGLLYTKDLSERLLFSSENIVLRESDIAAPNGWDDTTYGTRYLRFGTTNQAKYFIANNFSVNIGINLNGGMRTSKTIDGETIDDDTKWSYNNLGSTFGFTYYHR